MSGDMAVRGIREIDESGSIAMFTAESYPPYDRPPLSKGLWSGDQELEDLDRETADLEVEIYPNTQVTHLDRDNQIIQTASGNSFSYEKLLLAMGGTPRKLPKAPETVIYYRTLRDYEALRAATMSPLNIGVIGGGYIGSEIAAALREQGHSISMIFPEQTLLGQIFPKDVGEHINNVFSSKGVMLFPERLVEEIRLEDQKHYIDMSDGTSLSVDVVIAGLGIVPNIALAESAGLDVSDGIIVNEYLQTTDPNIYAAGDIANIYCEPLNTRRRVEHEQAANRTGKYAGMAMAGEAQSINNFLPMFYSDAFDVSWEGVGETSSDMEIVQHWEEPFKSGSIYYLRDGVTRGAIMWNRWGKLQEIRKLIVNKQAP